MKRQFLLSRLLLLFALIVGSVNGWADNWELVTSSSQLEDDGEYLIVSVESSESYYALSKVNSSNSSIRDIAEVSVSANIISATAANIASSTAPFAITLKKSGDNWNLYDAINEGYLNAGYRTTGSKPKNQNNLATGELITTTSGNNGVFTIEVTAAGVATITNQNGFVIQYNNGNPRIASYNGGGQTNVCLYKKQAEVVVTSLSVKTAPTKTRYEVGETLSMSGFVLDADGTEVSSGYTMTMGGEAISNGATLSSAGKKTLVVSYGGKTVNQNISVGAVTSIAVTTPPTKTSYDTGDSFDLTGMVITASLSTGELSDPDTWTKEVTGYTVDPEDDLTPSDNEVTITYATKTAKQAITVTDVAVTGVSLNKTSTTIEKTKTETLTATISPSNATNKNVTWESDDEDVATVDEDGKVTAVAEGTAKITVKSVADPTKKAECTITVTDGSIDLDVTGEIEITSFPSFSGSGYRSANPYTIGDYDWIATNCMLNNSCLQLRKSDGVLTSPTIKSSKGITVTVTVPTNSVTVSDGTSSSSTSNGVAILTTTKTSTTITISSGNSYAQVSKIKIAPTPANPSAPVDNGDNTITLTTTANMAGWRSFYDASQDYTLDENTKAYVATAISGTAVSLTKLNVTAIPHGEAVILKTTDAGHSMTLTETTNVATLGGTNLLAVTDGTNNVDGYRLGYGKIGGEDAVGFFKYTTTTAPAAGIVYIDKSNVNSTLSRGLSISFADDETTGINAVENANGEFNNAVYYNLSGQRVANPSKGLYIVNGKKVIIK